MKFIMIFKEHKVSFGFRKREFRVNGKLIALILIGGEMVLQSVDLKLRSHLFHVVYRGGLA